MIRYKSYNLSESQQRIIVDWREVVDDSQTLADAGFVKKSKITVLLKKELSTNPEDSVKIVVDYEGETCEYIMHKEQEFTDLICLFFKVFTCLCDER